MQTDLIVRIKNLDELVYTYLGLNMATFCPANSIPTKFAEKTRAIAICRRCRRRHRVFPTLRDRNDRGSAIDGSRFLGNNDTRATTTTMNTRRNSRRCLRRYTKYPAVGDDRTPATIATVDAGVEPKKVSLRRLPLQISLSQTAIDDLISLKGKPPARVRCPMKTYLSSFASHYR